MSSKSGPACLLVLACAVAAPGAHAAATALTVDADHSTAVNPASSGAGQVTYSGHVVITRGNMVIRGERAVVYTRNQRLEKAVVTGKPAHFFWHSATGAPVRGKAREATYLAAADTVELRGAVTLTRGGEVLSAAAMRYALGTQTLTAEGSASQRVHAVIPSAATAGGGASRQP